MKFNYEKLGNLIEISEMKNSDLAVENLVGMNINKEFIPSVANTIGTNLGRYKVIHKDQFACNLMHVGRDKSVVVSKYPSETPSIISPAYKIFQVKDKSIILPDFLMLYFLRAEFDRLGWFYTDSSIRGSLDWSKFCNIQIPIPDIDIQKKIVDIYQFFNDRIELKGKINNNLEQLLSNIYYHWFISYEKFNFTKFIDTELGEIPKGWRIGVLKDILLLRKNSISSEKTNGLPYLPIDIIPMNSLGIMEIKSDEEANSSLITFDKNDILIGAMRIYFHRVIISPFSGVTRSTCFVLKPIEENYLSYCLLLCNLDKTIQYAQNTSKGTTMPYAVWENGLGDMEIIIPPNNILNDFHKLVFPIIEKIRDSYKELNRLYNLRDVLIPKLMSGEIDVSKINCDL